MRGFTVPFTMRSLPLTIVLWAFMVMPAAQLSCDPSTQYEEGGQCCSMCGPGTSMSGFGTCQIPQCEGCKDGEYQDKYTREPKCQRQPYCDPNKNFEVAVHENKKLRRSCKCKPGFHCSSDECMTCVHHSTCGPGHETKHIGNQTHDTVCQKCPEGTFSETTSLKSVCQKWTECADGYRLVDPGTAQSDNICERTQRIHLAVIGVIFVLCVIVAVGLVCWRCRGKVNNSVKGCIEKCCGEEPQQTTKETYTKIPPEPCDTQHILKEQLSIPEEGSTPEGHGMTPEENLDEESLEQSLFPRTDNGNFVTQERGKSVILSEETEETQETHTLNSKSM